MDYEPIKLSDIKHGLPVDYHPFIDRIDEKMKKSRIRSEPWKVGDGQMIVKI